MSTNGPSFKLVTVKIGIAPIRSLAKRMQHSAGMAVLAAAALLSAGCATQPYALETVARANAISAPPYSVSAGDQLRVTVFDEPGLTGEFPIDQQKKLNLPLVGDISVAKMTTDEVATAIASALTNGGYVKEPRVTVGIVEYRPIYILGEVNNPGVYPFTPDMTFTQAVAMAGGFTPRAKEAEIVLERYAWGEPRMIRLGQQQLMMAPGDTLIVQEAFF